MTFYTTPRNRDLASEGKWVCGAFHADPSCSALTQARMLPPVPVRGTLTFRERDIHLVQLAGHHAGYVCRLCLARTDRAQRAAECASTLGETP